MIRIEYNQLVYYSIQNIPPAGALPERLIWIGRDNFYQLIGDEITPISEDIKPFFSEGAPFQVNLNRIQYCSAGIIKEKNLYWCAFSSGSELTNDYCFLLDYKNMLWAFSDFKVNCFGKRVISGRDFLYSGTYTGFVAKHDPAVYNNLGAAIDSSIYFPWIDFGDTQLQKKIKYLIALFFILLLILYFVLIFIYDSPRYYSTFLLHTYYSIILLLSLLYS